MSPSKNPWHWALGACLVLGLVPALGAFHEARHFASTRMGSSEAEQLRELRLPWTQPQFLAMAAALGEIVPEDAKLLCTPVGGTEQKGRSRWFLFLADSLYPRQVYVRHPAPASGTLMDYPAWLEYHFEVLGTDGRALGFAGDIRKEEEEQRLAEALEPLGIEWEFTYRVDSRRPFEDSKLYHNGVLVPLAVDAAPMEVLDEAEEGAE